MIRNTLGNTGYSVSPVVFGGIINMKESQSESDRFVSYAVDRGVNYFDVAPSYEDAEARLGPALESYRKNVYLACKTGERTAEKAKPELINSLKTLRTDYFDVYQLHAITTKEEVDVAFSSSGVMETLMWAKKEGYIRKIGFSTHSEDTALYALDQYRFDTVLFPMNWAMGINTGWGDRIAKRAQEDNFGLLAMKTLVERMWLEGEERVYPKSWCKPIFGNDKLGLLAMKYGFYKGAQTLIPPGNFEHFNFMLDNIDSCINNPLKRDELDYLTAHAKVKEVMENPIFS